MGSGQTLAARMPPSDAICCLHISAAAVTRTAGRLTLRPADVSRFSSVDPNFGYKTPLDGMPSAAAHQIWSRTVWRAFAQWWLLTAVRRLAVMAERLRL